MRSIPTRLCFLPVALAFFFIATFISTFIGTPALATDGVLEINQACAVNTGCFAGDTAGYPVTITGSAGRSYRLTSDLIVPDENTDGITISTSDVGIDLNNFAIIRSACVDALTNCTPVTGTGSGVEVVDSTDRNISVKNGSIIGMGQYGVLLGEQTEVTNLRVRWNRQFGISADEGSTISGSTSRENGSTGIAAGIGSTVSGNTASQNSGNGISASAGSTVSGNTAYSNTAIGISASTGSTVSGNTAYNNTASGILASSGSAVQHNTVRLNGAHGLDLNTTSSYGDNSITSNVLGGVDTGVNTGGNYCAGTGVVSATCP